MPGKNSIYLKVRFSKKAYAEFQQMVEDMGTNMSAVASTLVINWMDNRKRLQPVMKEVMSEVVSKMVNDEFEGEGRLFAPDIKQALANVGEQIAKELGKRVDRELK